MREPAPRWLLIVTLGLSALLHAGGALLAGTVLRPPSLDLELTLPMDVELGASEAIEQAAPPPAVAPPPPAPPPPRARPGDGDGLDASVADASVVDAGAVDDAGILDAGPHDAGVREPRAKAREAGVAAAPGADAGTEGARLPPGAQIAVRVDMARIRRSPLAGDVRALLAAIPDWKALLEGSGIDPLEQLDRLLLATPNLQRDKLVIAGRYVGEEQVVRDAVDRLASARGVQATWRTASHVPVAPWANADRTPRVIALVGPRHFTISREEDLPRMLALAAARARTRGTSGPRAPHPAEALLAMEPDEGLSLEVDGVAQFVRRARSIVPERLRLSAIEQRATRVALHGVFTYPDEARASEARTSWGDLRDSYARNTLVVLLGMSGPLSDARIEQRAREVRLEVDLSVEQTRLILGYVRELVAGPGAAP